MNTVLSRGRNIAVRTIRNIQRRSASTSTSAKEATKEATVSLEEKYLTKRVFPNKSYLQEKRSINLYYSAFTFALIAALYTLAFRDVSGRKIVTNIQTSNAVLKDPYASSA
ncbi:anion ABC transporter permease protein [Acrasis kona]|uniref:Anion ABC transporter permease protein n=1 Tax=Acrasis kona TaxID=1008807 RepID=A0AAW2YTC8_9EUKA